ncbi:hypothetical protein [Nocardioides mangrovi]|uniref:Alpha/beta hydrolase n=1 Tax=Nocardioides mangrovi TaxID=2874580 RepID=A0ABS7UCE2_9ACTN|nr:hypothetical protein [Nocardioides mangrovi]MBZ5738663.1 hypothetical protein [Nocardioides mangrovi]
MGARRTSGWFAAAALLSLAATSLTTGVVLAAPEHAPAPTAAVAGAHGTWRVQSAGGDQYVVTWTSPTRFPMTSDRPTIVGLDADAVTSTPTIEPDGRTVRVVTTSKHRPDPADLDVLLSGVRLDEPSDSRRRTGGSPAKALDLPGTRTLADDPGTPGPYDVVTSDYTLDPVQVAGMPEPIEMVGHVVEPAADAATGPRPLVLFLHGRHSVCYDPRDPDDWGGDDWPCKAPYAEIPSQLGYDYIQQVLASQGYATVSVRVNGINAQDWRLDDGGADARAQIVEAHLDHWADLAAAHQVDLSRVVLVGHSRGGEGVDRASLEIPLSAPYTIVGQVLIAPTDFAAQTAPYVPTVTLLPFCDGDVSDLQGQQFTDNNRDLAADDTSFKSSVLVMGANHNFFNTEWTPGIAQAPANDDWYDGSDAECGAKNPDRLSPTEQQDVGLAYVAGAVHLFADDDQDLLPMFDGSRARVASQGDAQTLSHAIGGGRDERRPGIDTGLSLASGAQTRFCTGDQQQHLIASCSTRTASSMAEPHWPSSWGQLPPTRDELEMSWTATGQSGGLVLDRPLDLSSGRLELRTIVDPRYDDVDLDVRITDGAGDSAVLTPEGGGGLPALGQTAWTRKYWAQALVVDPSTATGVDLGDVVRVDLVSRSAAGRVWVLDVASAPTALAPVPARRLPTVDISTTTIDEGDDHGLQQGALPFEVVGDLDRPARIVVVTSGQEVNSEQRFTVDLAPGQTSGSIPVSYRSDTRDDYRRQITQVVAWATRNVMTDQYLGRLTVRDDDPRPSITVTTPARRVTEGEDAVWRVRLGAWVDYDMSVIGRVVRGPGTNVRVSDVGKQWVRNHLGQVKKDKPLWQYNPSTWDSIPRRGRELTVRIPTRVDDRAEGPESLTLRLNIQGKKITRTVRVVDAKG